MDLHRSFHSAAEEQTGPRATTCPNLGCILPSEGSQRQKPTRCRIQWCDRVEEVRTEDNRALPTEVWHSCSLQGVACSLWPWVAQT